METGFLDKIFNDLSYLVMLTDKNMNIIEINDNFANLYKKDKKEIISKKITDVFPSFEKSVLYEAYNDVIKNKKEVSRIGYSYVTNNLVAAKAIKYEDNILIIAKQINSKENQLDMLHVDPLTSLNNRFMLEDKMEKFHTDKKLYSLILIDILKFKSINEGYGVNSGDFVLMEFAARLKKLTNEYITVYRYTSDQFAILYNTASIQEIEDLSKEIVNVRKEKFNINQTNLELDLSIGFYSNSQLEHTPQEVIVKAEEALKLGKKKKNTLINYSTLNTKGINKILLVNELKDALKQNKELELFYQGQVNSKTKMICGAEALIRWNHPEKGMVSPADFLSVAEEYTLMYEIDKFVFIRAIKDIYELLKNNIEIPISINISSYSLNNLQFLDFVKTVMEKIQIKPHLITIEVTESAYIEEKEISKKVINELKDMGFTIALDDFCTGYSSMEYLLSYPAKYLKIDRQFIKDINKNEPRKNIVKGLIIIANSLNMDVIAEGVENKEESKVLEDMNCNMIQGYFYYKPLSFHNFKDAVLKNGFSDEKVKNNKKEFKLYK